MRESPFEREQDIFQACLERAPSERPEFLRRATTNHAIRERVERLLAAHQRAEQFTLTPLAALPLEALDDRIGPYHLVRVLGEGGMGVVYEAEQNEPVKRRVALKVVKLGMDTREVVRRFQAEQQALAAMDHPSVAKVFDAGHTVAGRPYFVMERVDGTPLLDYCDAHRFSIRQRVELAALICQAVQHAHLKGVIHRDLKPSNVLVTSSDGAPLPKIIDFGIAKAAGLDATDVARFTRAGQALGTPAYMSPEQAGRGGQDVDTRTDVYSLGVILYELLTGQLPVEPGDQRATEFLAALAHGELPVPKPSARVSSLDPAIVARRSTTIRGLERQLQGDLDWICMKALEVDRDRRYETPLALADDLRRHLTSQPVLAGPPSRAYRLRRLVQRNRAFVAASAVAVVALLSGSAVAVTQAVRATRAERAAVAEAETAKQVADFLIALFEVADPQMVNRNNVTARELLDQGATRIQRELAGQPLIRARIQAVIGEIYRKLGHYDPAQPLLEQSLSAREQLLTPDDLEIVRTLHSIARLKFDRGDRAGAETMFRDAMRRVSSATNASSAARIAHARLQCELGQVLRDNAKFPEAEALFHEAIATLIQELGARHLEVGTAWAGLAPVFHAQGKFTEAETSYRTALAIKEAALGPDSPVLASSLINLASTLGRLGRDNEAEPLLQRALGVMQNAYGEQHVSVINTLGGLAALYGRQGRLDEAEMTLRKSLALRERIFGPDHPNTVIDLKNLGLTAMLKGDYEGARRAFERNLDIETKAFGPDHPRVLWTVTRMGGLHFQLAQFDAAEAAYQRARVAMEKALGADNIETIGNVRGLGMVALREGRLDDAAKFLEAALASSLKGAHPDISASWKALGELRLRQGRWDEALDLLKRALAHEHKIFAPGHPATSQTLVLLADVLAAQGARDQAERHYRDAVRIAEKAHGPNHLDVARALHGLGALLGAKQEASTHAAGEHEAAAVEAAALLERALTIRTARLGTSHPDTQATARLRGGDRTVATR